MQIPWSVFTRKSSAFPIWYQVYLSDGIPMRNYPSKTNKCFPCIEMMLVMATEGIYTLRGGDTSTTVIRTNLIPTL